SDRAELVGLGIPLDSHRDEHTGEELYTLRSERYFLPPLELDDDELAALQTCLYLLEGRFAYAEPLRLALQNLALGRSADAREAAPTATAVRVEVRDPDYTPELQGRLGKLEGAITKQRTVRFRYWSIGRDEERERTINPYALLPENGTWYVIGQDLEDKQVKSFRVSRIRSEIRFATRRERDFRIPETFDVEEFHGRAEWQFGDAAGRARGPARAPRSSQARPRRCEGGEAGARRHAAGSRGRGAPRRRRRCGRAARGPRRPGEVRRSPVAPRLPPRRLRRREGGGDPRRRPRRALLDPSGGARGASLAPEPRELRRRLLRGVR